MGRIFQFPKKNHKKHKWWHKPWVSKAMIYDGHTCYVCDKCNRWMIEKDLDGEKLVIQQWVDFETFEKICDGSEIANLKPRIVWILQDIEKKINEWLGNKKQN